MTWTAKVNGVPTNIVQPTVGALLRVLKTEGIISKYWYGEKIKRPIPVWISKDIVDIEGEDDVQS